MKKARIIIASLVLATVAIFTGIFSTVSVSADDQLYDKNWISKKALVSALYTCYNGHMNSPVHVGSNADVSQFQDLAKNDNTAVGALPTGAGSSSLTCKQVLKEVLSRSGTSDGLNSDDPAQQGEFLKKVGYTPTGKKDSVQCNRVTFDVSRYLNDGTVDGAVSSFTYKTAKICARVDESGNLIDGRMYVEGSSSGLSNGAKDPYLLTTQPSTGFITVSYNAADGNTMGPQEVGCSKGENFASSCLPKFKLNTVTIPTENGTRYWMYAKGNLETTTSKSVDNEFATNAAGGKTAAQNLLGTTTSSFAPAEIISLYQIYLNENATAMICGVPDDKKDQFVGNGYKDIKVNLEKNGETKSNCYVNISDKDFIGFNGNDWYKTVSVTDILSYLASHSVDGAWASSVVDANFSMYGEEDESAGGGGDSAAAAANTDDVDCFNSAGALGWILCPIISFVQDTITSIYDSIVSNFLEVNAKSYEIGGNVYKAWQIFQSFANIIFVIVFLIVIFSQVTGFGIDNFGIKRILPKLIVAAILINLSYIICLLAIDLSNILGVGLNSLFASIPVEVEGLSASSTGAAAISSVMTLAVGGAVGALAVGTVGLWGAVVIIPLFLGLLTTLLGVLFFFIILGVRQAAIVILVVISPVAFACYMLPNTKNIFSRWFKAFEGALIVYPICGALMGGSAFASSVLMTLDVGFLGKLIAMLVGVVPFFFIPTLLRNSMSAMGNIGARISGFGQGVSRRLTGAIGNSDTAREMQLRMNAGVDANGNANWLGRRRMDIAEGRSIFSRVPGMKGMNRRASARARGAYAKYLSDQQRQENLNSPDFFQKYQRSQAMAAEKEQLATEIDIVNDNTDKGENQGELFSMYDNAVASGNVMRARAIAEIAGRRKDTANAFIQKFKEDSASGVYDGHEDMLGKVAKQIATGDNSKNYRASNAMGFEYASQITQGNDAVKGSNGGTMNYGQWSSNTDNVHSAIDHHVTNGSEMYGQSNASLRELGKLASSEDKAMLGNLALRAEQEGREGGTYDITKEAVMHDLQQHATETNGGSAQPGGVFNVRGGGGVNAIQPDRPAGQTIRQANGAPLNTRLTGAGMERFRQHYQNKVDNRTATRQDYNALKRINRAINQQNNNNNNTSNNGNNNDNNGQA